MPRIIFLNIEPKSWNKLTLKYYNNTYKLLTFVTASDLEQLFNSVTIRQLKR